jgi:hypothetical protein
LRVFCRVAPKLVLEFLEILTQAGSCMRDRQSGKEGVDGSSPSEGSGVAGSESASSWRSPG